MAIEWALCLLRIVGWPDTRARMMIDGSEADPDPSVASDSQHQPAQPCTRRWPRFPADDAVAEMVGLDPTGCTRVRPDEYAVVLGAGDLELDLVPSPWAVFPEVVHAASAPISARPLRLDGRGERQRVPRWGVVTRRSSR